MESVSIQYRIVLVLALVFVVMNICTCGGASDTGESHTNQCDDASMWDSGVGPDIERVYLILHEMIGQELKSPQVDPQEQLVSAAIVVRSIKGLKKRYELAEHFSQLSVRLRNSSAVVDFVETIKNPNWEIALISRTIDYAISDYESSRSNKPKEIQKYKERYIIYSLLPAIKEYSDRFTGVGCLEEDPSFILCFGHLRMSRLNARYDDWLHEIKTIESNRKKLWIINEIKHSGSWQNRAQIEQHGLDSVLIEEEEKAKRDLGKDVQTKRCDSEKVVTSCNAWNKRLAKLGEIVEDCGESKIQREWYWNDSDEGISNLVELDRRISNRIAQEDLLGAIEEVKGVRSHFWKTKVVFEIEKKCSQK